MKSVMDDEKVIIVSYACTPNANSEHGLGWKWVEETAARKKVILITRPGREGLAEACLTHNIELIEVPVPALGRRLTQKLGDIGIWLRVYMWAPHVRSIVKSITDKQVIKYLHLVTFHSVWMPDVFANCDCTKVWGPVSGGEYVPREYLKWLGPEKMKERFRNTLNRLLDKSIAKKSASYDIILYGNSQTLESIERKRNGVRRLVMPNVVRDEVKAYPAKQWKEGDVFRMAFVGSCQGRRGLSMLFEALKNVKNLDWALDIAGTGQALDYWKTRVKDLGLDDRVTFHGWVGKDVVDKIYENAHLFVFPTLRDGGGSGMLEAIERSVPVLALDWGGPSDVIADTGAGVLFAVDSPEKTTKALVDWFESVGNRTFDYTELAQDVQGYDFTRFRWASKLELLQSALDEVS